MEYSDGSEDNDEPPLLARCRVEGGTAAVEPRPAETGAERSATVLRPLPSQGDEDPLPSSESERGLEVGSEGGSDSLLASLAS